MPTRSDIEIIFRGIRNSAIIMLILLAGVLLMPGCDYDDLKAESTAWRQRSDALQVERDELRAQASQIIRTAQLVGHIDEGALARLDEITAAIGVVSAAIDVAHDGIRKVDDTIQSKDSWAGLLGPVIGSLATAIPGGPLVWSIASGIWRKRFGTLVANVHNAGIDAEPEKPDVMSLSLPALRAANIKTGIQPLILKPLDAAKANWKAA